MGEPFPIIILKPKIMNEVEILTDSATSKINMAEGQQRKYLSDFQGLIPLF